MDIIIDPRTDVVGDVTIVIIFCQSGTEKEKGGRKTQDVSSYLYL